eukprot:scaffold41894_cov20-Tisochrysis_lutea.AAC.1
MSVSSHSLPEVRKELLVCDAQGLKSCTLQIDVLGIKSPSDACVKPPLTGNAQGIAHISPGSSTVQPHDSGPSDGQAAKKESQEEFNIPHCLLLQRSPRQGRGRDNSSTSFKRQCKVRQVQAIEGKAYVQAVQGYTRPYKCKTYQAEAKYKLCKAIQGHTRPYKHKLYQFYSSAALILSL